MSETRKIAAILVSTRRLQPSRARQRGCGRCARTSLDRRAKCRYAVLWRAARELATVSATG